MRVSGGLIEGLALLAIAAAVTFAGRALFAELHIFEPAAVLLLAVAIIGLGASMRRVSRASPNARLEISVRAAHITALLLAILATVVPSSWTYGAAIAMVDIAIAFDLFARTSQRR